MIAEPAANIVHGVFVEVLGLGVWIAGDSGIGKSELALELVTRGHRLVVDDVIEFRREAAQVWGRSPELLRGFMEVRGLGVINVGRMYGDSALRDTCALALVLRLVSGIAEPQEGDQARLFGHRSRRQLCGVHIDEVILPVRVGHNLAVLTETLCRDLMLRRQGYVAAEDFIARQAEMIAGR
jgi:HPr kinase/phosphorylase